MFRGFSPVDLSAQKLQLLLLVRVGRKGRNPDRLGSVAKLRFRKVPFSLSLDDPGPVLAVKGSASPRFAPWTAPGEPI